MLSTRIRQLKLRGLLDRLAQPRNLRRLVATFIASLVLALVLATVAIVRGAATQGDVNNVTFRLDNPPAIDIQHGLDRAISELTDKQSRKLLQQLLQAMSPKQRAYLRVLLRQPTSRRATAAHRAPRRPTRVHAAAQQAAQQARGRASRPDRPTARRRRSAVPPPAAAPVLPAPTGNVADPQSATKKLARTKPRGHAAKPRATTAAPARSTGNRHGPKK